MKAYEIIQFLEDEYPLIFQSRNDNSGLQIGSPEKDVRRAAVAYEKTLDVISQCVKNRCDMLITHRPLFMHKRFGPPPRMWWNLFKETINDSDMVIYSLHENLDLGINNTALCLSKELGLTPVEQEGQYLTCKMEEIKFKDFVLYVRKLLKPDYIIAVGNAETNIKSVGIVAGTAMDIKDIEVFRSAPVECYLSGDPDDFGIRYARDVGLMTINVDDYCLERPGIMRIYNLLMQKFKELKVEFIDCRYGKL